MIAPSGVSNGEEGPKSRTKPVFLEELCQVTVVPTFTQNDMFPLALGMSGVADAEVPPLRFTPTEQALVVEPQVVLALHRLPGLDSEQTYLLLLFLLSAFNPLADMCVAIIATGNSIKAQQIARYRRMFMMCLQKNNYFSTWACNASARSDLQLIDARCSFPVEHVHQLPRVLRQVNLQLPLLVNDQLGAGIQDAGALALVGVVDVYLAAA